MVPYLLGFAALCIVLSYGVQKRRPWMWYVGFVIFYLMAAYFGSFFLGLLAKAEGPEQEAFACLYLVGGLVFWMPQVILWVKYKHIFGIKDRIGSDKANDRRL